MNRTTRAQRINARHDKIWREAERLKTATRFNAESRRPVPFYSCGCCGQLHPLVWDGDCRDDANRFNPEDLDKLYGPEGEAWMEVSQP